MVISDWKRLLDKMLKEQEKTLFGKIDLEAEEVKVYGRLKSFHFHEEDNHCLFTYQFIDEPKKEHKHGQLLTLSTWTPS